MNLPNPAVEEPELNLAVSPPPSFTEIIGSFVSGILAAAFTYIFPGSSLSYYHTSPSYSPLPRSSYSGQSSHSHSPNHLHSRHTRSRSSSVRSTHDRPNSLNSSHSRPNSVRFTHSHSSVHSRHSSHHHPPHHHHRHSTQHGHQAYASIHKHKRRDCPHRPQQPAPQQPVPQQPTPQQPQQQLPQPQQVRFETAPANPPDPSSQPR